MIIHSLFSCLQDYILNLLDTRTRNSWPYDHYKMKEFFNRSELLSWKKSNLLIWISSPPSKASAINGSTFDVSCWGYCVRRWSRKRSYCRDRKGKVNRLWPTLFFFYFILDGWPRENKSVILNQEIFSATALLHSLIAVDQGINTLLTDSHKRLLMKKSGNPWPCVNS